jgi:hypothetical protein
MRFGEPGHDQARLSEFRLPKKDGCGRIHAGASCWV